MKNNIYFLSLIITFNLFSQEQTKDTIQGTKQILDEVVVQSIRVKYSSPISHSNISKAELSSRNLGQDLPILLSFLPSVVTTSDAGAGVGYTGIRIRGVSAQSTNITINGIPFNDPESHGTYWVNLPDFTSSIESLQVQRGVGTSTNGSGAFGASINILTNAISENAYTEISNSAGSYNTIKHTIKFSTGKLNNAFELSGRLSKIDSDGYIDRAFSDLKSYFLQGSYNQGNTFIKALVFGGHEKTYQSWYGVSKEQILENRRQNPYTYENEIDNYKQDHYQFHWNEKLNQKWSTNVGLNYTYGRGYFEQFKNNDSVETYGGIVESDMDENGVKSGTTDLIRRRWLDNDFYVLNASSNYQNSKLNMTFSSSYSTYNGDHFGEVIWARQFGENNSIRDRYYQGNGKKTDFSLFVKASYFLNKKLELYGDLQLRNVGYKTKGFTSDLVNMIIDESYSFFNPKFGLSYKFNLNSIIYGSYSRANREPSRSDYESDPNIKPEQLNDFEFGWRYRKNELKFNLNSYFMQYNEQLVLTGALDDVGTPIRVNSGSSYRIGIEADLNVKLSDFFTTNPNMTISSNKNKQILSPKDGKIFDFGKTNISFSPEFMTSNTIEFSPKDNFKLSLLSKYVGIQYMGNTDALNSKLDSYFVNDFNISYEINPNRIFKAIVISGLINNIFDVEYVSNGYYYTYDDTWSVPGQVKTLDGAGYYPQATRNFLFGLTLKF
ncbi:MAG: TonB-dependent receptor [Flavobacteriales bacterium]|jgi:iron complex outermembrane receptor protein|tara:strand:+ start:11009 stop:13171 length:2163 start_codon:yes stop_codon:yes gene_type:complete